MSSDQFRSNVSTRTLVLGMIDPDEQLAAADLYDVGAAAGLTIHQIRLCLARLVKDGTIVQHGRGRRADIELTSSGRRRAEPEPEFMRLAFDHDAGRAPWDFRWHLVTFSIPESSRTARNDLRDRLLRLGAAVTSGAYVSANNWDASVVEIVNDLGVADHVAIASATTLQVGGQADPMRLAEKLWNLDDVARRWTTFVDACRSPIERLEAAATQTEAMPRSDALATSINVIAAFDIAMQADPLLPAELLPPQWVGREGRQWLLRAAVAIGTLFDRHLLPPLFRRFDDVLADAARVTAHRPRTHELA